MTSHLLPDKRLLADLQNEEILTEENVEQILKCRETTRTEARRKVIDILLADPDENHFHQFLKILKQSGQERLCQKVIEKYEPWKTLDNPLAGVLLKTEKVFVESVRGKYKSLYQFIPRKPWINKDFMAVDKLFVTLEFVTKDSKKLLYKQYCDIFTDKSVESNRYVITGGPGAGKSTLTCKIAFDWSVGRLNQYVCVLLIKAREVPSDVNVCEYVAKKFVPHDKYNPSISYVVYNMIQSGQVMLMIDGFDEFRYHKDHSNEIMKIVNGDMFPTSPVTITTRPHYLPYLEHNPVSALVTFSICGFCRDDVKQYIKLYFSADKSKSTAQTDDIVTDITQGISKVNMWDVVSSPMICLLICFLYDQLQSLPSEQSDVYVQLMAAFKKVYQGKETVNRLSGRDWEGVLLKVGELALDMLLSEEGGRLTFDQDEVSKYIHPEVACLTGLINLTDPEPSQGITSLIDDCDVKWYQFLHKSVQEFCAAHYILHSCDSGVERVKCFIKDMDTLRSVRDVIEFVVDLSSSNSNYRVVHDLISHVVSVLNSDDTLKSISFVSYKGLWCDQMKWLHKCGITHKHMSNIKVLYLYNYSVMKKATVHYDSYVSGLMKSYSVTQVTDIVDTPLRNVILGYKYTLTTEQMTSLCHVLSVSRDLRHLEGQAVPVPDLGLWLVPDKHPHLEVIDLHGCKLSSLSVYSVISNLHKWTHLNKVGLKFSKIFGKVSYVDISQCSEPLISLTYINLSYSFLLQVLPLITHAIRLAINVRVLDLSKTNIDPWSVSQTEQTFESQCDQNNIITSICNQIQVLGLAKCDMKVVTLRSLGQCLPQWTELNKLDLRDNDLSEVGDLLLRSMPRSITKLYLSRCKLTAEAVIALRQCLSTWQCLKSLDLSKNTLCGLLTSMSFPRSIEELDLSWCNLTSNDMCAVARQLPLLSHLTEISLSYNPQTDVRVWDVFIECIPHCRSGLEVVLAHCGVDKDTKKRLKNSSSLVSVIFHALPKTQNNVES